MHSPVFIPLEAPARGQGLGGSVYPAAAVLFLDAEQPGRVLVGVRDAESNRRHPSVVSIPTIRIPAIWLAPFEALLGRSEFALSTPVRGFGVDFATESTEGAIVELTLAKKIIDGDFLNGRVFGSCAARLLLTDFVDDPSGRDGAIELTRMLTIAAVCERGGKLMEGSTGSYQDLRWVPMEELIAAYGSKDGSALFPNRPAAEVCVRGLCLKSAVEILANSPEDWWPQP